MFSEKLKELRKAKGLSIAQLANKAELTSRSISYFETNQRNPQLQSAKQIAVALNISLDELAEMD